MKNLIGIEFGEGTVSIYQNKKDGAVMLFKDIPLEEMEDVLTSERELQVAAIQELLEDVKLDGKDCAVVLPEKHSFFRTLYMSPMTEEELVLNIPYEFKDYIGDSSTAYTYDYAMNNVFYDENDEATEMEVFAAAGNTDAVDNIESIVEEVGLRLSVVIPREMAMINLMRAAEEEGRALNKEYCIVHIGYSTSRVDILSGGIIAGSKVIDLGMRSVDEAIASAYGVGMREAIEYRKQNKDSVLSSNVCVTVYDALQLEIMKAINFYKYEHQDSEINEIHFAGMEAGCAELRHMISEGLMMVESDIKEILPLECGELEDAYRGIGAIGVTL